MRQEYIFRCRGSHRAPAESGQESPTTQKEYTDPHKTRSSLLMWKHEMTWDLLNNTRVQPGSLEEFSLWWVILWLLKEAADQCSFLLFGRPILRYKRVCSLSVGQVYEKVKQSVTLDTKQKSTRQLTRPPLLLHSHFPSLLLLLSYVF